MSNINHKANKTISRRTILRSGSSLGLVAAIGAPIPFLSNLKPGLVPVALAQTTPFDEYGKSGLTVLNDRPLNMETPPHLLDDRITPRERFFVRNNGLPPTVDEAALENWTITIDGLVDKPLTFSIDDLKRQFDTVTLQLQMECGGNGRKFYEPGASGNQWTFGAIGCAEWTGVRLKDVLESVGVKPEAIYTAHYGADSHLSGDSSKQPLSRGMPISKALDEHNIIAWAMNGDSIPALNGAPLRLVVPGWPGSCSQKWLTRISLRDKVHDGAKMMGKAYRVPAFPVPSGTSVKDKNMKIIESMPVKSLITFPETGTKIKLGNAFEIRGHAWAGDLNVSTVDISLDFGATWKKATLEPPVNKYAWQHWSAMLTLPDNGYFEIWARATDSKGHMQPPVTPGWNPKGYLNNMQHRIAVFGI
ncbi:MAG: sulfite oxidase [Litorimonas sp.]